MTKFRIEYDKSGCIGAAACVAIDDQLWVLDDEGKADLTGHKIEGKLQTLEVEATDEDKIKKIVESAKVCPVLIIKVTNLDTGEELAP